MWTQQYDWQTMAAAEPGFIQNKIQRLIPKGMNL